MRYFIPTEVDVEDKSKAVYKTPDDFDGFEVIGEILENSIYLPKGKQVLGHIIEVIWLNTELYIEITDKLDEYGIKE